VKIVAAPSPRWNRAALSAALLLVFALYYVTAVPSLVISEESSYELRGIPGPQEHYNSLAEALLAGRTSLLCEPRPELLALDDPYDPVKNHQIDTRGCYCLHDASLYKGKYYLYFGVIPALTLFAPFLFLTGHFLSTAVGTLIFAVGGLVWSVLLLNLLANRYFPAQTAGTRFLLVLGVGCCNCVPFLLRSPFFYEVAILGAYFYSMGGLYWLARGSLGDRLRLGSIATGSLFLGLAIGCRPHMALVALVVFAAVFVFLWIQVRQKALGLRALARVTVTFAGPWLVCVCLLAAYNYHRFGSFAEFGTRYTLNGGTIRLVDQQLMDWGRLGADLYCYLFLLPELRGAFPYVALGRPEPTLFPPVNLGWTPIAGVLVTMPFLVFLVLAPLTAVRAWKSGSYGFLASLFVLLTAGMLELLCVASFSAAMRYTVDFANLLVFAALLVIFDLDIACQKCMSLKWVLRGVVAASIMAGCLFNLGISIEGQRCLPRDQAVRQQLRAIFPNLPFIEKPVTLRLQIAFPEYKEPGQCEPLVVTGQTGAGDFIYVRYLKDGKVAFLYDHWGFPAQEGKTVRVTAGRCFEFEANLRLADGKVVCWLDGDEVLAVDCDLYSFDPSSVHVGQNPIGGGLFTSQVYSGTVQSK
jgi:hypothetical protein